MTPISRNLTECTRGTTFDSIAFSLSKDVANVISPIDLTDAAIKIQFKRKENDATAAMELSVGNGITILDALNGQFSIDAFVVNLAAGQYFYDIKVTFTTGVIRVFVKGLFVVLQNTTA